MQPHNPSAGKGIGGYRESFSGKLPDALHNERVHEERAVGRE